MDPFALAARFKIPAQLAYWRAARHFMVHAMWVWINGGRQTLGCSPVFLNSWCRYHWIHQQFLLPPYQPWAKRQQKSQTSWRPKFLDQLVCSCLFLPSSLIHFDDFWWFLIPWIWIGSFWSLSRRSPDAKMARRCHTWWWPWRRMRWIWSCTTGQGKTT